MNTRYNYPRLYRVTVKHDHGRFTLIVSARNKHVAASLVMTCENCPRSAILAVIPVKG